MKKVLRNLGLALALVSGIGFIYNCYGSFTVTRKIYNWNGGVSNKFVNSAIMWVLIIIPVYPIATFIDFIFLNTIEFWTGSNPLAMAPGEKEVKIVEHEGNKFEVTASRDRLDIRVLTGDQKGQSLSLLYSRSEEAWYMQQGGELRKIAQLETDKSMKLFHPDGETVSVKL